MKDYTGKHIWISTKSKNCMHVSFKKLEITICLDEQPRLMFCIDELGDSPSLFLLEDIQEVRIWDKKKRELILPYFRVVSFGEKMAQRMWDTFIQYLKIVGNVLVAPKDANVREIESGHFILDY